MCERVEGGCYHVWVLASGGDAMFRRARCYTRSGAQAAVRRGLTGFAVHLNEARPTVTLKCAGETCPCRRGV